MTSCVKPVLGLFFLVNPPFHISVPFSQAPSAMSVSLSLSLSSWNVLSCTSVASLLQQGPICHLPFLFELLTLQCFSVYCLLTMLPETCLSLQRSTHIRCPLLVCSFSASTPPRPLHIGKSGTLGVRILMRLVPSGCPKA